MKKLLLLLSVGLVLTACSQAETETSEESLPEESYRDAMAEVICYGMNKNLVNDETWDEKVEELNSEAYDIYETYGIDSEEEFQKFNELKDDEDFKVKVRARMTALKCATKEQLDSFFGEMDGNEVPADVPKRATLTGEFICLPHAGEGEVHTMECAFGLKTEDGTNYALDTSLSSVLEPFSKVQMQERIEVSGLLVPVEQLSSDYWSTYDIKGVMQVTEVKQL